MFFDDFVAKLKRTSKKDRLKKIQEPYLEKATILRAVIKEPLSLKIILDLIPKEDRFTALTLVDYTGFLVIYDAIYCPDSFQVILESLSPQDRIRFLTFRNAPPSPRHTMLHLSIIEPNLLDIVLSIIPKKNLLKLMDLKSHDGTNCLQLAANNFRALTKLINLLPKDQQVRVVEEQNLMAYGFHDARSPKKQLYLYKNDPNTLLTMLLLVAPEQRINLLLQKLDAQNNTILHWLIPNIDCLSTILEQLPKADHFSALTALNSDNKMPIHYAQQDALDIINSLTLQDTSSALERCLTLSSHSFLFSLQPTAKCARFDEQPEVSCSI